ncbi:hypothetical protein GLYMA_20G044700v4 [Glycine max]|uniref:Uncharacterized protein n=1 Tax=Glycine max TaxID=3847 RepID=A0A0R0E7T4_SOYBN|nr:hypothetical protein GYH30_054780 [Glycine max]KRG89733.1 hypothetical protein GLYMA_20G044700v4 [Glycine max]
MDKEEKNYYYVLLLLDIIPCHLKIQHINCFCGIMRVAEIDVAVTKGLLGGHVLANSNGNDLGNLVEEIESITTRMIASL